VTLVSIQTPMAEKRETSGNETGNEIVSTTSALVVIGENACSRKRRKSSGRKRKVVFGCSLFPFHENRYESNSLPGVLTWQRHTTLASR